jgi:hypothetical protein
MTAGAAILSPSAVQLLGLVADFLDNELAPAQTDTKLRFRTRVAANLLRSARRELEGLAGLSLDAEGHAIPAEWTAELGTLCSLVEDLEHGRRMLTDANVYEMSLLLVEAKLAIVTGEGRNATS